LRNLFCLRCQYSWRRKFRLAMATLCCQQMARYPGAQNFLEQFGEERVNIGLGQTEVHRVLGHVP